MGFTQEKSRKNGKSALIFQFLFHFHGQKFACKKLKFCKITKLRPYKWAQRCYFLKLLTKNDQKMWKNLIIYSQTSARCQNRKIWKKYKMAANSKLKKYPFPIVFNVILLNVGKTKCFASETNWWFQQCKIFFFLIFLNYLVGSESTFFLL